MKDAPTFNQWKRNRHAKHAKWDTQVVVYYTIGKLRTIMYRKFLEKLLRSQENARICSALFSILTRLV